MWQDYSPPESLVVSVEMFGELLDTLICKYSDCHLGFKSLIFIKYILNIS